MQTKRATVLAAVALSLATLFLATTEAQAQRYGYGYGYRGGYYRPYGFYGYGGYPFLGVGIGVGFYAPYYGSYAYPLPPGYAYSPYPATMIAGAPPQAPQGPQVSQAPGTAPAPERPAPDGAGHLQLLVPANGEVFIDGSKISQTGAMREIVTPKLKPGLRYTYRISVRYPDASGKIIDDTREIRFQADDWFTIDFTRPAPPQGAVPPPGALQLQQAPSVSR